MITLPTNCIICKNKLTKGTFIDEGLFNNKDYDIFHCEHCIPLIQDIGSIYKTCFEIRIGKHSENYLTRILLDYDNWVIVYYPFSDVDSPPEITAEYNGKKVFHEYLEKDSYMSIDDWENWSDIDFIINKVKMLAAFT